MTKKQTSLVLFLLASLYLILSIGKVDASTLPVYNVSPTSKPFDKKVMTYQNYNNYTKQYYVLRSYLERLEKTGGGTLILHKGTYTITNTLYVPSNVKIYLRDGVVLRKGAVTGTTKMKASKSMFQLVRPSRANKEGIYGGYNGEKNIQFIGQGKAIIDLRYVKDSFAIIAGHNQNIRIQGIQFQNMYSGHFIELDASSNVVISKNRFWYSKASDNKIKEAINIDTPDKLTEGWSQQWSKFDKTPNQRVTIQNNSFYNLDIAVGTHNYSEGKDHKNLIIRGNTINKMRTTGIWVMNWRSPLIEKNVIRNIPGTSLTGIKVSGSVNATIRNNQFDNVPRAIQFMPWKNSGKAAGYETIYNVLPDAHREALKTNTLKNGYERFIRFGKEYQNFGSKTEYLPLTVKSLRKGASTYNPFVQQVWFAGANGAKAYQITDVTSESYRVYEHGTKLRLYLAEKDWYYGYMTRGGVKTKIYFHISELQSNSVKKTYYVGTKGAKAYLSMSLTGKVHTTYAAGKELQLFQHKTNDNWYYVTNKINGQATYVYFHKSEIEVDKPLIRYTLYAKAANANAYAEDSKESEVLRVFEGASSLGLYEWNTEWYYGNITHNGVQTKIFIHVNDVQKTKPNIKKTLYAGNDGANAYLTNSKTGGIQKNYRAGTELSLYQLDTTWYYVTSGGVKVYFHKDELQTEQP